jgi:hypothetical protein
VIPVTRKLWVAEFGAILGPAGSRQIIAYAFPWQHSAGELASAAADRAEQNSRKRIDARSPAMAASAGTAALFQATAIVATIGTDKFVIGRAL